MRWKLFLFVSIISVLIISFSVIIVSSEDSNMKVDPQVEQVVNEEGKAKIIVILKNDSNNDDLTLGSVVTSSDEIINTLTNDEIKNEQKFSLINGFAGEVTSSGLEKLKQNPNVIKIEYDYPIYAFLSESVPLINASSVKDMTVRNLNITGKGYSVCVIDSGVDYTHPNLGSCLATTDINDGSCGKVIGGFDFCGSDTDCGSSNNNDTNPNDWQGHGTHVSGIIASNHPIYTGVAPEANIVSVKIINISGGGYSSKLNLALDWCINHADQLNISVISMSLGINAYSDADACEGNFTSLTTYANLAVAKNISLIAASGNNGFSNMVSSPACIRNVTAIASVNDNSSSSYPGLDVVSSFSNMGLLVDILAPGAAITSTVPDTTNCDGPICHDSRFRTLAGTSQATPQVAGAVILLQQYAKLTNNKTLTPYEIKTILNNTGKQVSDSNGRIYSRVSVFEALFALPSVINLSNPQNNAFINNKNVTFNYTFLHESEVSLDCSLYLDELYNQTSSSITSPSYFIVNNTLEGIHNWYVNCIDSQDNNLTSNTRTFEVDLQLPLFNITSPINGSWNKGGIIFGYNLKDVNLDKCSLYGNWSGGWHLDSTKNVTSGNNNFTVILESGTYNWNIACIDKALNEFTNLTNSTLYVDSLIPNLTIYFPQDGAYYNYNTSINLNYSANDSNLSSVYYKLDSGSWINISTNVTFNTSEGNHILNISANDSVNNINITIINFTTDLTNPVVTLVSPVDEGSWTPSNNVEFKYKVNDTVIDNCKIYVDDTEKANDTTVSVNVEQTFIVNLSNGNSYQWHVKCTDKANRIDDSEVRELDVSVTSSPSSPSPGPSGGTTDSTSTSDIVEPLPLEKEESKFNVDFSLEDSGKVAGKIGEERTFSFDGNVEHKVKFDKVSFADKTATVTLQSDPVTVDLVLDEPKEVDLNRDNTNDVIVLLEFVTPDDEAQLELIKIEAGASLLVTQEAGQASNEITGAATADIAGNQTFLERIKSFFSFNTVDDITGFFSYENLKENQDTVVPVMGIGLVVIGFLAYRFIYLTRKDKKGKISQVVSSSRKAKKDEDEESFVSYYLGKAGNGFKGLFSQGQETKARLKKIEEEEKLLEEENKRLREMVERIKR